MSQSTASSEKENSFEIRVRTGWKDEETELLLNEVKMAEDNKLPLKAVFSKVAGETGRKPNSIRNYYYMKVKENGSGLDKRTVSFTPFSKTEIRKLLADVLKAQGDGESVRSCTLRLGGGDRHKMLRYQNKLQKHHQEQPRAGAKRDGRTGCRGAKSSSTRIPKRRCAGASR